MEKRKKMTYRKFLSILRKMRRASWRTTIEYATQIRISPPAGVLENEEEQCFCPLTGAAAFLGGPVLSVGDPEKAAKWLGLDNFGPQKAAESIVVAADTSIRNLNSVGKEMRRNLIDALRDRPKERCRPILKAG